ncbi:hypothetical protein PCASD_01801 [Puccinia coronata f. sp. avenae]|uniref:Uncharacterized protein n=1 Tax=Puccinia coronata f. sp. avenae TaxID=200324 RepID=A0A2N5VJG5_9BASI|nr:hypothetical protein PCASD_01801 [Puccinia coronata f. sp. avenae]
MVKISGFTSYIASLSWRIPTSVDVNIGTKTRKGVRIMLPDFISRFTFPPERLELRKGLDSSLVLTEMLGGPALLSSGVGPRGPGRGSIQRESVKFVLTGTKSQSFLEEPRRISVSSLRSESCDRCFAIRPAAGMGLLLSSQVWL